MMNLFHGMATKDGLVTTLINCGIQLTLHGLFNISVRTGENGITECANVTKKLTQKRKNQFIDLYQRSHMKCQKLPPSKVQHASLFHQPLPVESGMFSDSSKHSTPTKKSSESLMDSKIAYRKKTNQASIESSLQNNTSHLSSVIAKFVLNAGLPFSVVERDVFKDMIKEARFQPFNYKCPSQKQIAEEHLDEMYTAVVHSNNQILRKNAQNYGLYFYGDSATIFHRPLLNIMALLRMDEGSGARVGNRKGRQEVNQSPLHT